MAELDQKWPAYGFAKHAGYGTAQHLDALKRLGPCPEHRTTFEPIKSMLSEKRRSILPMQQRILSAKRES